VSLPFEPFVEPAGGHRVPRSRNDQYHRPKGDGAHSDAPVGALLPDALRWIFRDSK
jgi:hypothetical protein